MPNVLVHDLGHRGETVRRAGGVRDDPVSLRVVDLVEVDAEGDRDVRLLRGGGDDHLPRAGQVLGGVCAGAEPSSRLDDDVHVELVPRQAGRVRLTRRFDAVAVDDDRRVADLDRVVERAVDRVVLQELSDQVRVGDVVDRHPFDVGFTLIGRAERGATGAAEAIDGNPD